MNPFALALVLPLAALSSQPGPAPAESGHAEGVFARVPVEALEVVSGELPKIVSTSWAEEKSVVATWPYAVLEGGGEVYVDLHPRADSRNSWQVPDVRAAALALRLDAPREVVGRLFVPQEDGRAMRRIEFRVPASAFSDMGRETFLRTKAEHYERLLARGLPGAAWFRHQERAARKALGKEAPAETRARPLRGAPSGELDDTFELFGGGRAIAENLQLDRELPFAAEEDATVALDTIPGVETAAYDWSREIEGLEPELDPLARFIPADQHAAFFPSVEALVRTLDELETNGNPLLSLAESRAEDARARERYQRQLCLPFDDPDSELRRIPITQIAITGSDPYFRTGTDVAVLLASTDPERLVELLRREMGRSLGDAGQPVPFETERVGQRLVGMGRASTPDGEIRAILVRQDDLVFVTNSAEQLWRLAALGPGSADSLAQAPEYVFFRHRYPRSTAGEEGLLVLTDATIRRWAGPRLRLGASRRTQAAAWLADAQCSKLAFDAGDPDATLPRGLPDGSPIEWGDDGARSAKWGTTAFLTPIAELELERVTPAEEQAYARFRQRYQAGWRAWFDPIALQLLRRGQVLEADLTVRPLIAGSDYRGWMDTVGGSKLAPGAGDPHEGALVQFAMALDTQAEPVRFANSLLAGSGPDPLQDVLGWIGGGLGVYLEPDPEFFEGWRAAKDRDEEDLWQEEHLDEFPVALHVESKSPVKLALFMTSFRAFVEQSAPNLLTWGTHQRDGRTLVEITAAIGDTAFSLWYATLPEALIVTMREDVLLRAIARVEARRAGEGETARPWQGESLALRLDGAFLDVIRDLTREESLLASQATTWSALPILREYALLFPDQDPFALHEALFGVRLADPSGGTYAWDEAWATYASSLYGHPGEQVAGPFWPAALERLEQADLGLTFEADGLRAHGVLRRE